jgi:hypothetical protein
MVTSRHLPAGWTVCLAFEPSAGQLESPSIITRAVDIESPPAA